VGFGQISSGIRNGIARFGMGLGMGGMRLLFLRIHRNSEIQSNRTPAGLKAAWSYNDRQTPIPLFLYHSHMCVCVRLCARIRSGVSLGSYFSRRNWFSNEISFSRGC